MLRYFQPVLITVALLLLFRNGLAAAEQHLAPAKAAAVDQAVEEILSREQIPGAAIGIIQQGQIVYLHGYGLADRERRIPANTNTVFNWASNSKPLAAVLAMQLVERKMLDLDADIRTYVPEFPAHKHVITTRHLLCHQSGLPHYKNGKVIPTERAYSVPLPFLDPILALDKFNQSPLIFAPGEKTAYSSHAYVLLSAVIQRAGKEEFSKQLQHRISEPLGLKSLQLDLEHQGQAEWAIGYRKLPNGTIQPAPEEAHYWKHGAGGYKSNVQDFARWAQALLNHKLVSAETEQAMWTRQTTNDGKPTDWGLGFTLSDQGGLKVSHNGSQTETATRMVLYPHRGSGVVLLCNAEWAKPDVITTAIFATLKE